MLIRLESLLHIIPTCERMILVVRYKEVINYFSYQTLLDTVPPVLAATGTSGARGNGLIVEG